MSWKLTIVWLLVCAAAGLFFFLYAKVQGNSGQARRFRIGPDSRKLGLLLIAFAVVIVVGVLAPSDPLPARPANLAKAPPPAPTKADREIRTVLAGAQMLKEAMKKPESFELLKATMIDGQVICYEYRARNSFNDRRTEYYVVSDAVSSGEAKHWNKLCANRPGTDYTSVRSVLR